LDLISKFMQNWFNRSFLIGARLAVAQSAMRETPLLIVSYISTHPLSVRILTY
jgi:hypothetical protein